MKKIVKGNDFTLRIPVMKMVEGKKVAFPLPGCTDIHVRVCNQFGRTELSYDIDVENDNVILAKVEGDKISLGTYSVEVKGKLHGNDWRSEEYPQFQIVARNADADLEFGQGSEGDNSVEMDTALVILPPTVVLTDLIDSANKTIKDGEKAIADIRQANAEMVAAETGRVAAENERVAAENVRVSTEKERETNETERKRAEADRESNENGRISAENKRKSEFSEVKTSVEYAAAKADAATDKANKAISSAETATAAAVAAASTASTAADKADTAASNADTSRLAIEKNETARQEAEESRAKAETKRETDFATSKKAADDAASKANSSSSNADAATKKATDAATAAETATTNANKATEKANTAAANADAATKKATDAADSVSNYEERLTKVEDSIGELGKPTAIYYIASQNTDQASPNLSNVQTNRSVAMLENQYRPFLVDHTENTGDVMPADELMRNNWLRYADGRFAPAVGITEEMRAQCDVELYLDAEHTQKYCEAGEFDAEAFYNEYGMTQKLYDADGEEIGHILRPWETTSKNYSIKIGDPSETWLLDDYSPNDGLMYKGILKSFREVAGLKPKKLAPTLLSPTCDTSIKDTDGKIKFRSFFFLYNVGDTNTQGGQNATYKIPMFMEEGAYPRVNDVHQINSMTYARNNNVDASKTYPFCEAGFHAYNTFVVAKELQYGTNYINDPDNLFSSGTSSDDSCSNEAQWRKYGGVRFKMGDDGAWSYAQWGNGSPNVYKDANGGKIGTHMSEFLNYQYPKWMCNEAQIVLSFAAELGISEETEFEVYGRTYKYVTPVKAKGLSDGYMNAIVYRQVDGDWQGYTASGDSTTYHFEAMLRQGVMDGMVTSGDIFHYRGGGCEQVSEVLKLQTEDRQNYPTDLYLETDQKKFHTEKTYVINSGGGKFAFESAYEHLGRVEETKAGWLKKRVGYTPHEQTVGAGRNTYVTGYNDNSNYFSNVVGQRVRRAVRCGGNASWHICSARSMTAADLVSYASRAYGGSAQCLFSKRS